MGNKCKNCGVIVSEDLKYCPLCGKFVLKNEKDKCEEKENSFPIYDMFYIYKEKWLKIVRAFLLLAVVLSIAINAFFYRGVLWSVYVVIGTLALWLVVFSPFNEGTNHLRRIPFSSLVIAISVILLDFFNHYQFNTPIGWGVIYTAPFVLILGIVLSFILFLVLKNYDLNYMKSNILIMIISIIYFILRLFLLTNYVLWPTFALLIVSVTNFIVLMILKKKRVIEEINRSFHI